ncbi:hypothetical protein HAX54_000535 [Datura stramonium]|uniref:DUF4283 domain-containing protein n=1 Tax=Datura stramonium TaxID=4076 RepID=A0ABS8T1X4_DATST|nr:hypothetical protein [Datura stramonium]
MGYVFYEGKWHKKVGFKPKLKGAIEEISSVIDSSDALKVSMDSLLKEALEIKYKGVKSFNLVLKQIDSSVFRAKLSNNELIIAIQNSYAPLFKRVHTTLSLVPLWVKFQGLHVGYWLREVLNKLECAVGKPLYIDKVIANSQKCIDYEGKPKYCNECLRFGHNIEECWYHVEKFVDTINEVLKTYPIKSGEEREDRRRPKGVKNIIRKLRESDPTLIIDHGRSGIEERNLIQPREGVENSHSAGNSMPFTPP